MPHSRPFNLHPEKWFELYHVKSTQIFIGCHLIFFMVASTQTFFQGGSLKNVTYELEKKPSWAPWKKNLGRFYRVPFKSLLRVQIERTTVHNIDFLFLHLSKDPFWHQWQNVIRFLWFLEFTIKSFKLHSFLIGKEMGLKMAKNVCKETFFGI